MTEKIIEKFFGKKVCTEKLNIEGISKPLKFDIYDGYAICKDDDNVYEMKFPQLAFIKEIKELTDAVSEYCSCEKSQITVLNVLVTFSTLYRNGYEVSPTNK